MKNYSEEYRKGWAAGEKYGWVVGHKQGYTDGKTGWLPACGNKSNWKDFYDSISNKDPYL